MVYYITYYVDLKNEQYRIQSPAASDKVHYIARTINKAGEVVEIVSLAAASTKRMNGCKYILSDGMVYKLFFSFGRGGKLKKLINYIHIALQLIVYLLKVVKKDDIIIVYHSPTTFWLSKLLSRFQKVSKDVSFFQKVHIIFEVEEIYADVVGGNRDKEIQGLRGADGYIIPTDMLLDEINVEGAPFLICHGNYAIHRLPETSSTFQNDRIHCVYAGTLQRSKGAFIAADAAQYLTGEYHVHILGYGSDEEVRAIQLHINEVQKNASATVTYDGFLSGDEFSAFLESCSIGLVTQDICAQYNKTSFPSKTLVYLAHGLAVVSAQFDAIMNSRIKEIITFYSDQSPKSVADAIRNADIVNRLKGLSLLQTLDMDFQAEVKNMLQFLRYKCRI